MPSAAAERRRNAAKANALAKEYQRASVRREREQAKRAVEISRDVQTRVMGILAQWAQRGAVGVALGRKELTAAIDEQIALWADAIRDMVRVEAREAWQHGIASVLQPLARAGVRVHAVRAMEADTIIPDDLLRDTATEWLDSVIDKVKAGTQAQLKDAVRRAILNGEDSGDIVNSVSKVFEARGMLTWEAERLVRTAIGNVQDMAAQNTRDLLEERNPAFKKIMQKRWYHSSQSVADGAREGHVELDGVTIPWDENFVNPITGEELAHAHDPSAPLGETINCACRTLDNISDDADLSDLL